MAVKGVSSEQHTDLLGQFFKKNDFRIIKKCDFMFSSLNQCYYSLFAADFQKLCYKLLAQLFLSQKN